MHSQIYDCQGGEENFDIKFPAGEALHLLLENAPGSGERVLTVGSDALAPPLVEVASTGDIEISAQDLDAIPEGRLCLFNLWQRDGATLEFLAEGRFVRRATIAPELPATPFVASASGPLLLFDGDSVMHNMPGTRIFLEQLLGHKFRFPEGYQNATGGDSAQKIYFGAPEVTARIETGNTVVLVGPIGANQTPADDSFAEITGFMEQVFDQYLAADALVVAVPTLLDGMGVTTQDAKKTALADWVAAYANGGTVEYDGVDYVLSPHEGFHAIDVSAFDRDTMKSDVSHPNVLGAEYLAKQLADVLIDLVAGSVHDPQVVDNILTGADEFQGSRTADSTGVSGVMPSEWGLSRAEGSAVWTGAYDPDGAFQVSVMNAPDSGTCILTLPTANVNTTAGDIVSFAVDVEIVDGATGLKSVGLLAQGQSPMTLDPDWAAPSGKYHLRTADEPYQTGQATQSMQVYVRVDVGASVTIKFLRAAAFFVENTANDLRLSGVPIEAGAVNETYNFAPVTTGGLPPFSYDLAGGLLPIGLTLNTATGAIMGSPEQAGLAQGISVRVTDANNETAVLPYFSIDVAEAVSEPPQTDPAVWDATLNTASPEQLSYSVGDTVVSATSAINGLRHTRGVNALNGKRYFECLLGPQVLGVGLASSNVTALLGGGFGIDRCFWSGSFLFHTGANVNMGGPLAEGDVVQVAVDNDTREIWMRRNGTGDWNNIGGADPASGVGGLDVSGIAGDIFAYAGLQNDVAAQATLIGSSADLTYSAPGGFEAIA